MTNGEKLQSIFSNIDSRLDAKTGIMIVKWADNTTKFFKTSWWNAEYKEPSIQERQAESDKFDAAFQDGYNNGYAQARFDYEQEPTYCPKFRNQQEKHRVFHTVTAVEKFFSVIGNDDAIDDISILKELVRKIEVMEDGNDKRRSIKDIKSWK